jgi:hypothetical protein
MTPLPQELNKVATLISRICDNQGQLSELLKYGNEILFVWSGHHFSIVRPDKPTPSEQFKFYIYPSHVGSLQDLAAHFDNAFGPSEPTVELHMYNDGDFEPHTRQKLEKLYIDLLSRTRSLDSVLDKLLKG